MNELEDEIIKKCESIDKAKQSKLAKQANHFDSGNTMSQFRQMRLTLSGKSSTGIEASALKVYEAEYQYTCQILNYGNSDQQERLLSRNLSILGKDIPLIANAYAKNISNIREKEIYDIISKDSLTIDEIFNTLTNKRVNFSDLMILLTTLFLLIHHQNHFHLLYE